MNETANIIKKSFLFYQNVNLISFNQPQARPYRKKIIYQQKQCFTYKYVSIDRSLLS